MLRSMSLSITLALLAITAIISAPVHADEPGLVYDAPFPVTVSVDGDLSDWPLVTWHKITHNMGWDKLPESDDDASLEFACAADEGNLYVALKIRDDSKCVNEDTGRNIFQDDSVEIYIDADNSKPAVDMNIVHYNALYVIGTTAFAPKHQRIALKFLASGRVPGDKLVTHRFRLSEFKKGATMALEGKVLKAVFYPDDEYPYD